jgi:hypothetical protein
VSVALEVVTIPRIDGTTGGKEQITASDRTRVFPRPRIAVGLPLTTGLRAFAGGSYIPPLRIRGVATHDLTLEAGVAWVPGTFRAGLRLHGVLARSTSPVTDPATRDVLTTREAGADLSAGVRLELAPGLSLEPYAGAGLVALHGHFRVTSDGNVVESDHTGPALHAGARLLARERWEAVVELAAYPGRLVHPGLRLGYVFP